MDPAMIHETIRERYSTCIQLTVNEDELSCSLEGWRKRETGSYGENRESIKEDK